MEKYCRRITVVLSSRLDEPARRIIVVVGPRQVGKTTAIRQVLAGRDEASYVFYPVNGAGKNNGQWIPSYDMTTTPDIEGDYFDGLSHPKDATWLTQTWRKARQTARDWQEKSKQSIPLPHLPSSQGTDGLNVAPPFVLVYDEIQKIPD